MKLDLSPKATDHLVPTPIVQQTAFWGRVHRRLGFGVQAFDVAFEPAAAPAPARDRCVDRGDFLVVRSPLADGADYAYVPLGPEIAPDVEEIGRFLERVSLELKPLLGSHCAFIRWDLPWTSLHARAADDFDPDGEWRGPPEERLREIRMNFGTRDRNLWKAPRDLLPADTVLIDLEASEEAILARMHHKTRYNIRLAERRGVVVEEGHFDDLPAWYDLYLETMARHALAPMPIEHFETLLDERAESSASPVLPQLLLARDEHRLLAGMLLAVAPSRATYLYGASSHEGRQRMAPSALQWAAIRFAKKRGCKDYDLLGAAPRRGQDHALAGVHRFKTGFGGRLVHREGCWDFPYREATYAAWRRFEEGQVARRAISS